MTRRHREVTAAATRPAPHTCRTSQPQPLAPSQTDRSFAATATGRREAQFDPVLPSPPAFGARNVLDVGCGTGNLAALLRRRAATVTGLEPDPATARAAAERFADDPAVTIVQADFADRDRQQRWDAVTLVAVLHHLPLVPTMRELRGCLTPGGRLVVVGCYREDGPADLLATLPAALANPVMGLVRHPARAAVPPSHMTAPTADPQETLSDIRSAAARELPGARMRRRLFWRYTLVYDAPA